MMAANAFNVQVRFILEVDKTGGGSIASPPCGSVGSEGAFEWGVTRKILSVICS